MRAATALTLGCAIFCGGCSGGGNAVDAAVDLSAAADLASAPVEDLRVHHDLTAPPPKPTGGLMGVLVDENGGPVPGAAILACSAIECITVHTGNDGSFGAVKVPLGLRAIKAAEDLSLTPRRGEAVTPVDLTVADQVVNAGTLYALTLGAGAPIGNADLGMPETLSVGDGVSITISPVETLEPIGVMEPNLTARAVPLAHVPPLPLGGEKVLAAFGFAPFGTTSSTPIAFAAPLPSPVAAGTAVHLRTISELDGSLSAPIAGHVQPDGMSVKTDDGAGLPELTWVVVSSI